MRNVFFGLILVTLALGLPTLAVGEVDLEIVSYFSPPVAFPGHAVGGEIILWIRNAGPDDITSPFNIGFYVSTDDVITTADQLLIGGRESEPFLAAGAEVHVNLFWGASIPIDYPLGPAFLGVIVDEFNVIAETDETNNTAALPVQVDDYVPVQNRSWGSIKTLFR